MARLVVFLFLALVAAPALAMPMVIPAVAAMVVVQGLALTGLAAFAVGALVNFAVSSVMSGLQSGSGKQQSQPTFQAESRDRMQVVRSSVETRRIVYGEVMVSGPLVFAHSSGANNEYLHLVIPLAGHECDQITQIYLNDYELATQDAAGNVTSGRFADHVRVKRHLGASDQAADPDLMAESGGLWTSAHRLRGVAYIYVRFLWNQDVFPTGIPNVKAIVFGKKVYDPRSGLTAWSDNWALAVRDYLASSYGLECTAAEIDDTTLIAAANACDEDVAIEGGTQPRYTCNGTVNLADRPVDIMQQLLSAGAGACVYTQGVYKVYAGAYRIPSHAIDESWLRGGIEVQPRTPRRELYNGVRGTFSDPAGFWQPTDFPPVTNATYEAQDADQQIFRDIELPFTTNVIRAQRIAKIHLEKSRQGITAVLPCNMKAFGVAVWDTVELSIDQLGWESKVFIVTNWKFNEAGGIDLSLQEEASAVYDWALGDATTVDAAPDTNLPSPFDVEAPGTPSITEMLYETRDGRGVAAKATMSWGAAADAFVVSYQPEYKLAAAAAYTVLPRTSDLVIEILDIAPGIYQFREKAINSFGVSSPYSTVTTKEITGLSAEPEPAVILGLQAVGGLAILTLEPHPALDVRRGGRWLVRHSEDSILWEDSFSIGQEEGYVGDQTILVLPLKAGTYQVKPEDSTGHASTAAATITTKQASVHAFSTIATLTEEPVFAGTHDGTLVASGNLQITAVGLFDDIPDFDAIGSLDAYGGILPSGTYTFAAGFDFGAVSRRRITGQLRGETVNVLDSIDERTGNIDEWLNFDGTGGGGSTDAWIEYRETDDDPTGAPTWSEWKRLDAAEVEAWGVQCRLRIVSTDLAYNQYVDKLGAIAEEVV